MLSLVYVKTETGRQAFKERAATMPPKLRSAFLLFDGTRNAQAVMLATAGLGITSKEIMALVELGYLVAASRDAVVPDASANTVAFSHAVAVSHAAPLASPLTWQQERYKRAYPIAAQLTAGLGLRGFRLHLAVEGTQSYEQLRALTPKIRAAIGVGKSQPFEQALDD